MGGMEEAQRMRESGEVQNLPPDNEADEGIEDPNTQSDTLQIERSDAGAHVFQHGGVGEEREIVDPHGDSVHTERNRQESDAFLQEQETAELQNDSPHSEGSKPGLMVLPLGGAGAEQADPATGSYSLEIEGDVLASHVFRKEVGREREDADPQGSSRERNESNLKVFLTGDTVTEREDTDPPSHPSHSESKELETNLCVVCDATDPPSVVPYVSTSDSSVQKLGDNPSPVPPGTNIRPRRSGIISKLSRLFRRSKSPQGTEEKKKVSPVIVEAAKFKDPLVVAPGKPDKWERNGDEKDRCHPVRSVAGECGYSSGYRDSQSSRDPSLYAVPTTSSAPDTRNEHASTKNELASDGEHAHACCVIVICGFKLL